jgi:hypothetical protein
VVCDDHMNHATGLCNAVSECCSGHVVWSMFIKVVFFSVKDKSLFYWDERNLYNGGDKK